MQVCVHKTYAYTCARTIWKQDAESMQYLPKYFGMDLLREEDIQLGV